MCVFQRCEVKNKTKEASVWASTLYQSVVGKEEFSSPLYHARQIPLKVALAVTCEQVTRSSSGKKVHSWPFSFYTFYSILLTWPQKRNAPRKQFSPTKRVCQCFFFRRVFFLLWPASTNPNFWAAGTKLLPVFRKAVASVWNFYERLLCSHYAGDWIIWMVPKYFPEWKVKSSSALSRVLLYYMWCEKPRRSFSSWSAAAAPPESSYFFRNTHSVGGSRSALALMVG